jgi:glycosyltransferase involved in cell wall biosynthesis
MRVIHIVHGKVNPNGHNGISRVVYHLNKEERALGVDSEIWAVVDDARTHYNHRRDEHVTVECFPRVRLPFGRHEIIDRLLAEKDRIDLVHFHIIWFYDKNIIAKALNGAGIPFIITTHGTYSKPHAMTGKRRLARLLFERSFLNAATEIHVITDDEARGLKRYGYKGRTFAAPNGIALDEVPCERRGDMFAEAGRDGKTRLIWIGVKREDKNLVSLIRAVALLPEGLRSALAIILVGPDYNDNEAQYRALASELGAASCFTFVGPLYGQEKYDALESADVHILPSLSEVFSLAMLDAMACAKPCLVSTGCGYDIYGKDDFFISFQPEATQIAEAITEMFHRRQDWYEMGRNARRLIERELNWPAIASVMVENYRRIAPK